MRGDSKTQPLLPGSVEQNLDAESDKGSTHGAFFNLFKQLFGAGILALPHAFHHAGLLGGIFIFIATCVVCVMSMIVVLRCKDQARRLGMLPADPVTHSWSMQDVQRAKTSIKPVTYPDVAAAAFGTRGYVVVAVLVVLLELAFCIGWIIVACNNLVIVLNVDWLTRRDMAFILFPVVAVLSCIRWLKDLWILSLFGVCVYFFGVMGVTYYDIATRSEIKMISYPNFSSSFPLFFGTAMYTLEGILLVLPVSGSMKHPERAPAVVAASTGLFTVIACVFGAVGYIYGLGSCAEDNGAIVTDCLPHTAATTVVRVMLAISLIVGYPCLMYPVSEIVEELVFGASPAHLSVRDLVRHSALRMFIVLFTCVVAAFFTDFSVFSGAVGAILVPVIGFFVPALIHITLLRLTTVRLITVLGQLLVDVILVVLGVLLLVVGVYTLVAE